MEDDHNFGCFKWKTNTVSYKVELALASPELGTAQPQLVIIIYHSVNIKPPRHPFGFSHAWGWQYENVFVLLVVVLRMILTIELTSISVFN